MSYKLVISKPGYNALTETNPDHLVFSSDYNTFKYHAEGSLILDLTRGTEFEEAVHHGLGYKPVVFCYAQFSGASYYYFLNYSWADIGYYMHFHAFIDNSYLRIKVRQDQTRSTTVTVRYKIYRNNLGL